MKVSANSNKESGLKPFSAQISWNLLAWSSEPDKSPRLKVLLAQAVSAFLGQWSLSLDQALQELLGLRSCELGRNKA